MPTVTIHISNRGTPLVSGGTSQTGHMWYELNDGFGNRESYGFAPVEHGDANGPGQVYTDDSLNYLQTSHSQTFDISQNQFEVLQSFGQDPTSYGFSDHYNGIGNSCIDFTWKALEEIGFNPSGFEGDVWPTHNINDVKRIKPPKRPGNWYDQFLEDLRDRYDGIQDRTYRVVRYDPIAIDLDGDGLISTVAEANYAGALFDHDGDGIRTATGWVRGNDGLLVRDIDGNGLITDGNELFGDQTRLGDGSNASHGFAALADLDGNSDGVLDASDASFATLKVWQDANGNGITDAGELRTLAELGITSVSTGFTEGGNAPVTGGSLFGSGTFTRVDGNGTVTQGLVADFNFDHDPIRSEYVDELPIPVDFAGLPDMDGVGQLRDLRQSATLSEPLEAALRAFSAAGTRAGQLALIDDLLLEWAKTSPAWRDLLPIMFSAGGGVEDPSSENIVRLRPGEALMWPDPVELGTADRHMVRVVETILGLTPTGGIWWGEQSLNQYREIHAQIMEAMYGELVTQTRLKQYLAKVSIQWSAAEERVTYDFSMVDALLSTKYATDPFNAVVDLAELLKYQGAELAAAGYRSGFVQLQEWAATGSTDPALATALQEIGVISAALLNGASQATGGASADVLVGGAGSVADFLHGGAGDDLVGSGDGADTVYGDDGNDVIVAGAGDDYVSAGEGSDMVLGEDGRDSLRGDAGDDALDGGAGDDAVYGGAGDDRIYGGSGEDYLSGDAGNDVYVFRRNDGHDRINNYDAAAGRMDTLLLADVLPGAIKMWRSGDYLCISVVGTDDRVDIQEFFEADGTSAYRVDRVQFADGTIWDVNEIKARVLAATEGDDDLYGYETDDVIAGGDHADWLSGRGGNDTLSGGTGADSLQGDDGDDLLNGDAGNDNLSGGTGADQLFGGADNDRLDGGDGNDRLSGGAGNDQLDGGRGNDIYVFSSGFGQDIINNYDGDAGRLDAVEFTADITVAQVSVRRDGNDLLLTIQGADQLRISSYFANEGAGYTRVDEIRFASGTVWQVSDVLAMAQAGTDGNDVLQGYAADDAISGGAGDDDIRGNEGNDVLSGGEGMDLIDGGAGNDEVHGGDGSDTLFGGDGADLLTGGLEMDALSGGEGNDRLEGGAARDWLHGGTGDDELLGGDDADELVGGVGTDHLTGDTGDDLLEGGEGDDTYHFQRGDGKDRIRDVEGLSTIDITQLTLQEVYFRRDETELVIRFGTSADDEIRLADFFDSVTGLALYGLRMRSAEGAPWLMSANDLDAEVLRGTSQDDEILGNSQGNTVNGLAGGDIVHAEGGDDVISGGDGDDLLYGQEGDDQLHGDNGNDLLFGGIGNDALAGGSGDDQLDGGVGADQMAGGSGSDVYQVENAGDVVIEASGEGTDRIQSLVSFALPDHVETLELIGSASIDAIGNEQINELLGNSGANVLDGRGGVDRMFGFDGNDTLLGGQGDDHLDGGTGVDELHGGTGDDVYFVDSTADVVMEAAGEGRDSVNTTADYILSSNVETLVLVEGSQATNGTGSVDDNLLIGNSSSNRLDGAAGADRMEGRNGNDTYVVDDVGDVIVEVVGEGSDTVESSIDYALGVTLENLVLTGEADISGTGNDGDNVLVGNSGNNRIDGGLGGDDMYGGAGNDYFINDTNQDWIYEYEDEGTDTVERRYETNLVLSGNVENLILVAGIKTGNGNELDNTITGNSGANTLGGWDGNDILHGLDGDDSLFGGSGSDVLMGGNGADYLDGDEGIDHLEGGAGNDVYVTDDAGDVVVEASGAGTDQVQTTASYALSDNIENLFLMGNSAIDGSGNALDNYIAGNDGANVIRGFGGSDTIVAAGGNDTLIGGAGDDKYVVNATSGTDTVDNTGGGFDGVFFTDGIVRDRLSFARDGNDLLISVDNATTPSVRVVNHFLGGDAAIDYVQPDGGSYLSTAQINQIVSGGGTGFDQVIEGTAAGEQLVGGSGKDLIKGLAGADQLFGMGGNDTLQGGDGDDYLSGGNGSGSGSADDRLEGGIGNDTLAGEDGNDTLLGGAGDDDYVYGGGQDIIDNTGGGYDGVFFNNGVTAAQLGFTRSGDDLVITVGGNPANTMTVTNHFLGGDSAIDYVQPSSGAMLDTAAINALVGGGGNPPGGGDDGDYPSVVTGTAAGEQLLGTNGRDLIKGLGGNDTVFGFNGDDKLDGGDGDDYLSGGNGSHNGSGNDILIGGAGVDQLVGEDGDDQMFGGIGNDKYIYGGGADTIDNTGGGTDWLHFNSSAFNVARNRITFHRDADDLIVRVDGDAAKQVRVLKHFLGGEYAIAYVQPGSGNAIPASQFSGLLTPLSSIAPTTQLASETPLALTATIAAESMVASVASSAPSNPDWQDAMEVFREHATTPSAANDPVPPSRELQSLVEAMSSFSGAWDGLAGGDGAEGRFERHFWSNGLLQSHRNDSARLRYMEQ